MGLSEGYWIDSVTVQFDGVQRWKFCFNIDSKSTGIVQLRDQTQISHGHRVPNTKPSIIDLLSVGIKSTEDVIFTPD